MRDSSDDNSLVPTGLDLQRLKLLEPDGRVESENRRWIVLRYPPKGHNWRWCEFSLIVNCEGIPPRGMPYELKTLKAVISFLGQLECERKR